MELRRQIEAAHVPPAVMDYADRELRRLPRLPPNSSEASLTIAYLELLSELPWVKTTEDNLDLARARLILDRDHFDLDKVKRRLVEFLAVCKLNPTRPSPVLCLAGPPGVGKTSLGQSIADALGRKFTRTSLGGVADEDGDPRTPPHVCRCDARPCDPGVAPRRGAQPRHDARRDRQARRESLRRSCELAAGGAGPAAEPGVPRPLSRRCLSIISKVIFIATANYMDDVPVALRDPPGG